MNTYHSFVWSKGLGNLCGGFTKRFKNPKKYTKRLHTQSGQHNKPNMKLFKIKTQNSPQVIGTPFHQAKPIWKYCQCWIKYLAECHSVQSIKIIPQSPIPIYDNTQTSAAQSIQEYKKWYFDSLGALQL